ncbi:LysR family transcriptional regulator [Roseomonas populi]|uniref:LysR family transcriptional regulator n=1 Tax=Roseomonas populi TaxID=3121582 RepID=A0ABT1X0L2_9PROT|nr:LysR family transcriptional regulator [Roseomonas pecuniae]MCR0981641.1 LysR family transcriptional regulator [Roseomonas pecuniae]
MPRSEVNRAAEMEVFARVVEEGGFSAAARALGLTPSAVSKLVARLETRLGARLVQRSTRQFALTPEGQAFHERAVRILAEMEEAERAAAAGETPVGLIRVNTSATVNTHLLAPVLPEFLAAHPGIRLDLVLTDRVIDLVEARVDVAIRAGPMPESRLRARKLGETRLVVVGSPAYLAARGIPRRAADLAAHELLGFGYARAVQDWPFMEDGRRVGVKVAGRLRASDGEGLRQLALHGAGLVRMAGFCVREDILAGRLVPVLEEASAGDLEAFHAVHAGGTGPMPARVRALLDFLAANVRIPDAPGLAV